MSESRRSKTFGTACAIIATFLRGADYFMALFPPTTYEEVFSSMYAYIDRLFNIVRPRKLLYMAIDGVAPRAKMNQQRARRFRASRDNQIAVRIFVSSYTFVLAPEIFDLICIHSIVLFIFQEEMEEKLRQEFEKLGKPVLPKQESQVADSNVITPGTEFMYMLSGKLQSYIRLRRSENPAWGNIKVILSDGNVPGEGEHKIMAFIRAQRSLPGYDPNTRHCLYGMDADLIMLALATHEIHFSILREEVLSVESRFSPESTLEHSWRKAESEKLASRMEALFVVNKKQHYQFLNVWILREYLAFDLAVSGPEKLGCDLERIIDDFIFMCFLAGNDFLPHMPSLEIHEAEDKKGAYIKLKRAERYILLVGAYEEKIFSKRAELRDRKLRRILAEDKDARDYEENQADYERGLDVACSSTSVNADDALNNTKELKQKLKDYMRNESDLFKDGVLGKDKVKFGTPCWRERYYMEKFAAQTPEEAETTRKSVVCLILKDYITKARIDCASLLKDLNLTLSNEAEVSERFTLQTVGSADGGVLPPGSAHALPSAYKGLMVDENSNIIDFYPTEFETDIEGKRYTWQGICKLPFIDEERLLTETRKLENELKEIEKIRNLQNLDLLFVRCSSKTIQQEATCSGTRKASERIKGAIMMDSTIDGIKSTIHLKPEELSQADDYDLCLFYEIVQGCQYVPRLIEGVIIPEKTVNEADIPETILWHERHGSYQIHSHRCVSSRSINYFLCIYKLMNYVSQGSTKADGADRNFESVARSPAPAVTHKGAGSGFTLGRGKAVAVSRSARPDDLPKYAVREHGGELRPGAPAMHGDQVNTTSYWNHGARCRPLSNSKPWRGGRNIPPSGGCGAPAVGWQRNYVERSGQVQPPNQSSSGNSGRGRERGWFVDRSLT
ncbi:UNVERIFIED_CONTAM: 5'-3' exoribonuclease 3 [Sesamum latifolium]|uniref:5'-3' exoribonuclease 3 n=1 Tax=Sesamum latifolium TaxID=2727402 RepID=A0AAW2Y2J5_9LAMI